MRCRVCNAECTFTTCGARVCVLAWKKFVRYRREERNAEARRRPDPGPTQPAGPCTCGSCVACEFSAARQRRRARMSEAA